MDFINNSFETARLTHRTALKEDIDELGHVNNAVYVKWIQDAATEHWFSVANESFSSEYIWFCSRHEIDYKQQFYLGDTIEIRTWLGAYKGARFNRHVDIRAANAKTTGVNAVTTWVLISKTLNRPVKVKPEILKMFC